MNKHLSRKAQMNELFKKIPFAKPISLEIEEFDLLRQLIFDLSGIHLQNHKKELLCARLYKRLQMLGLTSFRQYYDYLTLSDFDGKEQCELLNAISTNKTEFFREKAHFEFLNKKVFPSLADQSIIRILSAGCSTGEEPYTLAMTAFEYFGARTPSRVSIHACDINTQVLEQAKRGIYSETLVKTMPRERLHRFFLKGSGVSDGLVKVSPKLRNILEFKRHNLMDSLPYPFSFHIIFCRNVVIYFDRETQTRVFQRFLSALKPKGYLIIGHSESLVYFKLPLRYIQPAVYQKKSC